MCSRIAVATLARADLASELVFRATNAEALRSAVSAGLGVMLVPRSRIPAGLDAWDDGPLPPPPAVYGGVFIRDDAGDMLEHLADRFAEALRPPEPDAAPRPTSRVPPPHDVRRLA
jgi:DNA-binding transcriptional LysR family regulator